MTTGYKVSDVCFLKKLLGFKKYKLEIFYEDIWLSDKELVDISYHSDYVELIEYLDQFEEELTKFYD